MSAPFPEMSRDPQGEAVFGRRDESWRDIPERGTFVPYFYDPSTHPEPEKIQAGEGGNPFCPGFTIADVAPEFRWVYRPDGNLIEQRDFEIKYMRWRRDKFRHAGVAVPRGFDERNEPIPSLKKVCRLAIDPKNPRRLRDVHFDPDATQGAKPEHFYTGEGEKVERDRMEILVEQYWRDKSRLTASEVLEVQSHLRSQGVHEPQDSVGAKLGVLTELLHDGALSTEEYVRRVEALTGEPSVRAAQTTAGGSRTEKPKPDKSVVMACGKKLKDRRGVRMHERKCELCQKVKAATTSAS